MKTVLTAIGSPMLNNKFRNIEGYKVLADDIKTDKELIEYLERGEEIDILFLCSTVIKNYSADELIETIRRIQKEILIVFFKGDDIESSVKEDEKLKIYTAADLDLKILEALIQKAFQKNISKCTSKVIVVSGASGIGKSTFSTFLAKNVENKGIKTLLVDFDLDESQVGTILKVKKNPTIKIILRI